MWSGYWQVALDEVDREKATFACHAGLFKFRVMPFGLANAPGAFQQLMSVVLAGLENFSMEYLDDILVFSSSVSEHLQHLQAAFEITITNSSLNSSIRFLPRLGERLG